MQDWETIGLIGVDAGLVMLIDPCYIVPDKEWSDFCDEYQAGEIDHATSMECGGVVVQTAHGDGQYPVEARYNEYGKIAEVRIKFEWETDRYNFKEDSFKDDEDKGY